MHTLVLAGALLLSALIIAGGLSALARSNHHMTQAQDDLTKALSDVSAKVSGITTVAESAVTTMQGLVDALNASGAAARDAGDEEAATALEAFADTLGGESTKLAAAITASTPAAPGGGNTTQPNPPAVLSLSPDSVSAAVGVASQVAVSASGGTGPYSLSGAPGGMSYDGTNVSFDATTTAFTGDVGVADSSTPPLSATLAVTIA